MNKEFIPYEQALALKELGFDDEVLKVYDINSSKSELYNYGEVLTGDDELYAPLYQQAFRWLYQKLSIENGTMPLNTETQQLLLKELIDKVSSKHLLV
jgi:hypothetical protein